MTEKENGNQFKRRLYQFTLRLVSFIEKLPKDRVSYIIADQLLRSGTSIMANYIEAYAASSRRDFTNFFSHSLKSANESKFWIALLRDTGKANKEEANPLLAELDEICRILGSSVLTLRGKK